MIWLVVAGLVLVAVAHSVLGEQKLLAPLFRKLGNSEVFPTRAQRLVRWVWHMLSAAWIVLAGLLVWSCGTTFEPGMLLAVAVLSAFNAGACFYAAGPKHPGAVLFFVCCCAAVLRLSAVSL